MRIPIAFELAAGPFGILGFQERYQFVLREAEMTPEYSTILQNNALAAVDLIGRRSIQAVGLNVGGQIQFGAGEADKIRSSLLQVPTFEQWGMNVSGLSSLVVNFDAEEANFGRLNASIPDARDRLVLEVNYHFELANNARNSRPQNAISRFDRAVEWASAILSEIAGHLVSEQATS